MAERSFLIEGRFPDQEVQRSWLWEIFIPNISTLPIPNLSIDEEDIIIRAKSVVQPGFSFDIFEAQHMGFKKQIPIKKNITNKIPVELEEFQDRKVLKLLYGWSNFIFSQDPRDLFVGNSSPIAITRNIYTKNIVLKQYAYNGAELDKSIVLLNAWPSNMSDLNLSYNSNESVKYNVEFSFDDWYLE